VSAGSTVDRTTGARSACRSERIAKYNRLLEIEQELGKQACFGR
jgi:enolase